MPEVPAVEAAGGMAVVAVGPAVVVVVVVAAGVEPASWVFSWEAAATASRAQALRAAKKAVSVRSLCKWKGLQLDCTV